MLRFETHSHTMYSNIRLLDSINRPERLAEQAIKNGLAGIAITDHEALCCHVEMNMLSKKIKEEHPDFKLALGNEIYLTDTRENGQKYYHFILIAKDAEGHRQLRELSSLAWLNSYFDRGLERVPTLKKELEEIIGKNPGHIVATTACIGGELGSSILELEKARRLQDVRTEAAAKKQIIDFVLWCKKVFGEDFYFEVAPAANKEQIIVNKKIAELSVVFNVKMVIGTDAHYLKKEDRYVHEAYLNSNNGEREVAAFYEYSYLQTEEEIIENLTPSIVDLYDTMCKNSMEIYDKIEDYSLLHSQQIPKVEVKDYRKKNNLSDYWYEHYPILASMFTSDDIYERYWVNECVNKIIDTIDTIPYNHEKSDPYYERLEEEADIKRTIGKALDTNMFAYPITLQHYVDLFWECGSMVGAGRGSSCSGLNHYLLGITQLDPIEWNLPFWRYLNKERFELGDIDLDLCPSKRPLILQKIKEERGQNFLPEINDTTRKNCGCTLIATFGTETTKSAIQTACRGYRSADYPNGIDVDTAQYMSALVPQERGFLWPLSDVIGGNDEKGRKPVKEFLTEVNKYPGLLEVMQGIEGLVNKRSSHASGVILFDEDPYQFGCFMRTPSGEVITQYNLHMCEAAGMTKYDFLVTEAQDKLVQAIKFLQEYGEIEKDLSLREVYNKYFHPNVLPIEDDKVWSNIQNVKTLDLFQFDSPVGKQAAKKIKPRSMLEMADANGLMRLMTSEEGGEQPIDKYVRFKNNINLWYDEMKKYGLTEEEMESLKPHFLKSHGVPPSQEQLMTMLMDENICSFSLKDANSARKIVGKKQMNKIPALHEQILNQAKSPALGKYIWDCGVGPQMGYSFSIIHALAYSFIGFQTAYIATKWNPIYWDTACLVVNSGALEVDETSKEKSTDYGKIAKAISAIQSEGVKVSLANINQSDYGFKPDIENDRILYGLKGINQVGLDVVNEIMSKRPFVGFKDFINRCKLKKPVIINLIKAGAFDEVEKDFKSRKEIMVYYIYKISEPKTNLTLQNFSGLISNGLVPQDYDLQIRYFKFNKYIKNISKKSDRYIVDDECFKFIERFFPDLLDHISFGEKRTIDKSWIDSIYQQQMDIVRKWLTDNKQEILKQYNIKLFKIVWDKYATGTLSKWEMDSLCFYHGIHELANVKTQTYGISDFKELSPIPEVTSYYRKVVPIYKLYCIAGTVLAKNDSTHVVTILTTTGVVNVKFTREYYAMFKKQISQIQPDGTKKIIEKGWFSKGNKLLITGFRRDDQFVAKTYASTERHQLYIIDEVFDDGQIKLRHDRYSGANCFEEEEYELL